MNSTFLTSNPFPWFQELLRLLFVPSSLPPSRPSCPLIQVSDCNDSNTKVSVVQRLTCVRDTLVPSLTDYIPSLLSVPDTPSDPWHSISKTTPYTYPPPLPTLDPRFRRSFTTPFLLSGTLSFLLRHPPLSRPATTESSRPEYVNSLLPYHIFALTLLSLTVCREDRVLCPHHRSSEEEPTDVPFLRRVSSRLSDCLTRRLITFCLKLNKYYLVCNLLSLI